MLMPSPAQQGRLRFLVLFARGPNWREGHPFKEQPEAGPHAEYMEGLRREGTLVRGVPLADASGSVVLLLVLTLEEARRLVEGDPMIVGAVMRADLYEWQVAIAALER